MRIILIAFMFGLANVVTAQKIEKLWTGTTTVTLSTTGFSEDGQLSQQVFYRSPGQGLGSFTDVTNGSIGERMFRAFMDGRLKGYADEELKQPLKKAERERLFVSKDTVQVIDPDTYESRVTIVARMPEAADYRTVRLKLKLSYFSDGSLQQEPLCFSFLEEAGASRVFFPAEKLAKSIDIDKDNWNGVNRMMPAVSWDELEMERGSALYQDKTFDHLFKQLDKELADHLRNAGDWSPVSAAQLDRLLHPKDTITIIDPNTYESEDREVDGIPFYEGVGKIRLVQFWAWDDAAARFVFSPIGYAPLEEFLDGKGGSVAKPPFYWVEKGYRK